LVRGLQMVDKEFLIFSSWSYDNFVCALCVVYAFSLFGQEEGPRVPYNFTRKNTPRKAFWESLGVKFGK